MLRKGVYPYEDMDSWEKLNETSLPNKETFYSELNKEGITNEDYTHVQNVWKVLKQKILVSIIAYMFKLIHYCLQICLKTLEKMY